jgi:hypothetical protein
MSVPGFWFQDGFIAPEKWFRPDVGWICLMTTFKRTPMLRLGDDVLIMLETILLLLGLGSCALSLIAF